MSTLTIPAGEAGRIRVFALSMTDAEAKALSEVEDAQAAALGAADLNHDHIEVFAVKDLEGVGLAGYLLDGHDAVDGDVAEDKQKLAALGGWVIVVLSNAFGGTARALTIDPRLTLIGSYRQNGVDWTPVSVTAEAAQPNPEKPAKKPMSEARISGMVATAVLLFLAVFVVIFVMLAG